MQEVTETPSYTGPRRGLKRPKLASKPRSTLKTRKASVKRKKKVFLKKPTSLKKADELFSAQIRKRDEGCLYPNCGRTDQLTCSHYFGRTIKSTRFDPDNCVTLCRLHHYWDKMIGWEFQKQREEEHGWDGRYTLFMKERLGEERWLALLARARESTSQKRAISAFMETVNIPSEPTEDVLSSE